MWSPDFPEDQPEDWAKEALEKPRDMTCYTKDIYLGQLLAAMKVIQEIGAWDEYYELLPAGKAPPTPQTVRSNVTKFLRQEPITQTAFLKFCGVNSNTFGRFMNQRKDSGWENGMYDDGKRFFYFKRLLEQTKAMKRAKSKRPDQETPKKSSQNGCRQPGQKRPFESTLISKGDGPDGYPRKYKCTRAPWGEKMWTLKDEVIEYDGRTKIMTVSLKGSLV